MTTLKHEAAADLLFASGQTPDTTQDAIRAIAREYRLHPDVQHAIDVVATEYGEHWETAAARKARCLELAPDQIELPDAADEAEPNGGLR